MRNIGAGNNAKIFFVKGKKADKRKNENRKKNSAETKPYNRKNFRNTAVCVNENIFYFRVL